MTRFAEISEFLAHEGWGWAERTPLAGDASARRYERLRRPGALAGAILMDMPPESGLDVRPFLAVTAWLRAGRFSAPEVLGADARRGLVLLERRAGGAERSEEVVAEVLEKDQAAAGVRSEHFRRAEAAGPEPGGDRQERPDVKAALRRHVHQDGAGERP